MRLSFSDDQRELFDVFDEFFRRESPPAVVRRAEPLGFDRPLWDRLNTMELWGPHVGVQDLCVIGETVGRAVAPVPFAEHAVVARLLADDAVRSGASIGALSVRAADSEDRWVLVPAGAVADVVVGVAGEHVVVSHSDPPGRAPANHACAPLADRSATDGTVTTVGPASDFERTLAEWKVITAAMLVGLSARALEMALEYVTDRQQFGVPVGSFQAVQHGLADLPGSIDGARLLVHKAAAALDGGEVGSCDIVHNDIDDPVTLASMALLFASDVAEHATDRSLHFHGGYGFAEEYDIQLYYRRARGWPLVLGDPTAEAVALSDRLFAGDGH